MSSSRSLSLPLALAIIGLLVMTSAPQAQVSEPPHVAAALTESVTSWLDGMRTLKRGVGPGAMILSEVSVLDAPGTLPNRTVMKLLPFQVAEPPRADEGVVVIVAAVDAQGQPLRSFNRIVVQALGQRGVGRHDNSVGGAFTCLAGPSAKRVKTVIRVRGGNRLPTGAVGVYLIARVGLNELGVSRGEFQQSCDDLADDLGDAL